MRFSYFTKVSSTIPILQELSWSEFVERLSSPIEVANKLDAPALSPAEWPAGARRSNDKVLRVHFAALDLDKITEAVLESVLKTLEPFQYVLHTTYSHAGSSLNCLRVYLPLSRPVEVLEWPAFWKNLNQLVGNASDHACKDLARVYFVPSIPPGTQDKNYLKSHDGEVLNVDNFISRAPVKSSKNFVSITSLETFAKNLLRKSDSYQSTLGAQILKVAQGEIFAEPGGRDAALFKICARLAERWPKADPEQIATLFEGSLSKMRALSEDAPTIEDVIEKLSRKQTSTQETEDSELRGNICDAFRGERDTPYTEQELQSFATEARISRDRLNKRWIIRKGDSCYLFLGGQYGSPVSMSELVDAARVDLSPATTAGVECFYYNDKGQQVEKREKELLQDYSSLARHVVADLSAQKSTYDWKTQTLTEAPCPMRDLAPVFSKNVDQYLRLLGADSQEQLLDWVSLVTKLETPCAALFLHGTSGAGKSLLALGLARLWTKGNPTQLKDVLGSFNDSLSGCPLV
ncbi:MAG: hypothetical protein WCK49_03575, partial [Myxococcaceae bacterium]